MTGPRGSDRPPSRRAPASAGRRFPLSVIAVLALAAGGLAVAVLASGSDDRIADPLEREGRVTLVAGDEVLASIEPERAARIAGGEVEIPVALTQRVERGPVTQTMAVSTDELRMRLAEAIADDPAQAVVEVPRRPVASRIEAPIVQQAYRNNCETAALSMLLATVGVEQDQLDLQELVAKAEPLDPVGDGEEMIWGDPNEGYVGRAEGGGPAGGFGVFDQPIAALAGRWSEPVNLTGERPQEIYRRLLAGHAVMVWIGLSDGPYQTWRSPAGDDVTVNFGEHTVVLTGIEGDQLFVNDPIDGLRKTWSKADFEAMWELLDRRAVSV